MHWGELGLLVTLSCYYNMFTHWFSVGSETLLEWTDYRRGVWPLAIPFRKQRFIVLVCSPWWRNRSAGTRRVPSTKISIKQINSLKSCCSNGKYVLRHEYFIYFHKTNTRVFIIFSTIAWTKSNLSSNIITQLSLFSYVIYCLDDTDCFPWQFPCLFYLWTAQISHKESLEATLLLVCVKN